MRFDLRDAFRSLLSQPALTLFTISILAVAFTSVGLVLGLVNGVLLRPFPFPSSERLVMVWDMHVEQPQVLEMTSLSNYLDYRSRNRVFVEMAAWQRPASMTLIDDGPAEELIAAVVTSSFFSTLRTPPALGRDFLPEDARPGSPPVAILSHGLWQRRFGSSPAILGQTLRLDEVSFRIIGVAPAGLENPTGPTELWVPMTATPNAIDRGQTYLRVVARLKPQVSFAEAQAEMEVLGAALELEYPATNTDWTPRLVELSEQILGPVRGVILTLLGAAVFLLLVAAANVSNMHLVKVLGRDAEMAARLFLGASQRRLVRLVILEIAGVAIGGAVLTTVALLLTFPVLSRVAAPMLPRALSPTVDGATLAMTFASCLGAAIAFGLPTALYAARLPLDSALSRGRATAPARRLRRALVVAQIALAFALLVGSGLVTRSLLNLGRVPLGFDAENVLSLRLALGDRYQDESRRISYFQRLIGELEALPSVRAAGAATVVPMSPFGIDFDVPYHLPGERRPERAEGPKARFRSATPGTFDALGVSLLEGRDFTWDDDLDAPRVVIVNRTLARRLWGSDRALGRTLWFFWSDWRSYEVVGVVDDARSYRLRRDPEPELFVPYSHYPYLVMNVVLRSSVDPDTLTAAARDVVLGLDPAQPLNGASTMESLVAASTARETLAASLLLVVATAALVLALLGIHGILSFSIRRKKREIGIRTALGAEPRAILTWALEEGARATIAGIAIGVSIALLSTRWLSELLFGVGARDPFLFALASVVLFAASLLACYLAVRPALAIDPASALRSE